MMLNKGIGRGEAYYFKNIDCVLCPGNDVIFVLNKA